jgi:hypothetical protein
MRKSSMPETVWKVLKWFGVACFSLSTIIMLNPHVAATSVSPWALFIVGNVIWASWAFNRDWALFGLSAFYFTWDVMIFASRYIPHLFDFAQPIIKMMEIFK